MQKICITVSPLGFGHVTRQFALIDALLNEWPDLDIKLFCSSTHAKIINSEYNGIPIETIATPYFPLFTIDGYDRVNKNKTLSSYRLMLEKKETGEFNEFWRHNLRDARVIINDIESLHNEIAKDMGIPIVNISNFTWSDLLTEIGLSELSHEYYLMEALGDLNIRLPFTTGCKSFPKYVDVGLLCRNIDFEKKVLEIDEPYAVLLLGNINRTLDLMGICNVLIENSITPVIVGKDASIEGVYSYHGNEVHNLIGHASVVLGKVGYSTVSEIYCSGVPFIHFKRQGSLEDNVLSDQIMSDGRGIFVDFNMTGSEIGNLMVNWSGKKFLKVKNANKQIASLVGQYLM